MADDRTAEQIAADDQLCEAVRSIAEAYGDGLAWVPTEYVLVYSIQRWDEESDAVTAVGTACEPGTTPMHRLLGLIEYAATRYRRLIADGDED